MANQKPKTTAKRKTPTRKKNKKSWWVRYGIALTVTVGALFVAACIGLWFAFAGYSGSEQWIYIPSGATEESIADTLEARLGSGMASRVKVLWSLQGGTPEGSHGAYCVTPGQSAFSISRNIAKGRQTPVKVSFIGVRTLDDLAARVTAPLDCSAADFLAACDSVLPPRGYDKAAFPAAFIPDTYEFYWSISAPELVKRLADTRDDFWTPERREKASALGTTPVGIATIASIAEEETAKPDEIGKVGRLYLNRLARGMKLQADPTVKFAIGDFSLRRINKQHLKTPSPYNTYLNKGLPPGPIRIVEKSSLQAVLDAPPHDYIYMCAKEDFSGYHNFATDYSTHQANAARYQAELDRRGIK